MTDEDIINILNLLFYNIHLYSYRKLRISVEQFIVFLLNQSSIRNRFKKIFFEKLQKTLNQLELQKKKFGLYKIYYIVYLNWVCLLSQYSMDFVEEIGQTQWIVNNQILLLEALEQINPETERIVNYSISKDGFLIFRKSLKNHAILKQFVDLLVQDKLSGQGRWTIIAIIAQITIVQIGKVIKNQDGSPLYDPVLLRVYSFFSIIFESFRQSYFLLQHISFLFMFYLLPRFLLNSTQFISNKMDSFLDFDFFVLAPFYSCSYLLVLKMKIFTFCSFLITEQSDRRVQEFVSISKRCE